MKTKKASASLNAVAPYDDQKWRAQDDCRTLMEAEKIKMDPKRFAAAKKEAAAKAIEMQQMADAAEDLAKGETDSKTEDAKEAKERK